VQIAAATPGNEDAARALHTIRQVMPARLRHRVGALQVTTVSPGQAPPVDGPLLLAISSAIRAREVLRFDYGADVRRAEPHHVVTRGGRWYLVAWDLDRSDWRTFRVDMIPRTPGGPRFAPREFPGGDVAAYVTGVFRGSPSGDWPAGRCGLTLGSWSWVSLAAACARFDADLEVVRPVELREAFARLAGRFAPA
jgi:WYL domain-containing protein